MIAVELSSPVCLDGPAEISGRLESDVPVVHDAGLLVDEAELIRFEGLAQAGVVLLANQDQLIDPEAAVDHVGLSIPKFTSILDGRVVGGSRNELHDETITAILVAAIQVRELTASQNSHTGLTLPITARLHGQERHVLVAHVSRSAYRVIEVRLDVDPAAQLLVQVLYETGGFVDCALVKLQTERIAHLHRKVNNHTNLVEPRMGRSSLACLGVDVVEGNLADFLASDEDMATLSGLTDFKGLGHGHAEYGRFAGFLVDAAVRNLHIISGFLARIDGEVLRLGVRKRESGRLHIDVAGKTTTRNIHDDDFQLGLVGHRVTHEQATVEQADSRNDSLPELFRVDDALASANHGSGKLLLDTLPQLRSSPCCR